MVIKSTQSTFSKGTYYAFYDKNKPVIVLVHGLGLTKDMWYYQLDELCNNYSVLVYDLAGMGQSESLKSTTDLTMFSLQLAELMDELNIQQAVIVGFSLGGMITRRFAMDYPERVRGIAVLNSAYKRDATARMAIQKRVYQAQEEGLKATVEAALYRWFTDSYRLANPDIMEWVRKTILANNAQIYPKNYQVLVDGVDELVAPNPPITCPTLIMTAEQDYGNSVEMAHQIAAEIENSQIVILSDLRHMAMIEAPNLFNKYLLNFLNDLKLEETNV